MNNIEYNKHITLALDVLTSSEQTSSAKLVAIEVLASAGLSRDEINAIICACNAHQPVFLFAA